MKIRRVMIASLKSGSGKTTITCALLQAFKNMGQQVVAYKCGPDYIDPMFHQKIIGIPSKNLDTFFTGEEETRALFLRDRTEKDFAVLEGVMGLFDGLGGVREEGSSYHLAKVTKTPIVLVIDAKGMGRSVIPMLAGFLDYDKERLIRGIILNRITKSSYEMIKPLIEQELRVSVLGYLPNRKDLCMESRHLGLVMPDELVNSKERLLAISEELTNTVSMKKIMEIAEMADELEGILLQKENGNLEKDASSKVVIAVAKDEAFCFYYEDNLRILQENGAEIKYFSPMHDDRLSEGCHALLIGGGYPELYASKLSGNIGMRTAVKQAFEHGMPIVAECGGFLYLHSELVDKDGKSHAMAGILPSVCSDRGELVRFGYVEIQENKSCFLPKGEKIKGHEFHYFDSMNNGEDCMAIKPVTKKEYPCVIEGEHYWLGFPHLYYPSNPAFAKAFVKKAEEYKKRTELNAGLSESPNLQPPEKQCLYSYRFFENKDCKYFPCHSGMEELNCLFCYCPLYGKGTCPGNPEYIEREGRKIKACTNCTFPHQPENYDKVVKLLKIEK